MNPAIMAQIEGVSPGSIKVLELIAQGSVGVAMVVAIVLFLRDRRETEKTAIGRDERFTGALDAMAREMITDRRRSDDRFEKMMDRVIENGHEMAVAVVEIKGAVENQGRAIDALKNAIDDIRRTPK